VLHPQHVVRQGCACVLVGCTQAIAAPFLTVCIQADGSCEGPVRMEGHAVDLPAVPFLLHEARPGFNVP
jgi:hypothetical protein